MKIILTKDVNAILVFAGEEAVRTGWKEIRVDHAVLAILRFPECPAVKVLRQAFHIDVAELKAGMEAVMDKGTSVPYADAGSVEFSEEFKKCFRTMILEVAERGRPECDTLSLMLAILADQECEFTRTMKSDGIGLQEFRDAIPAIYPDWRTPRTGGEDDEDPDEDEEEQHHHRLDIAFGNTRQISAGDNENSPSGKNGSLLARFGRELTAEAAEGRLDPVVGRDRETARVEQILCRRKKNNPVLVGESGVGKSSIVEGLAQRIAAGKVPAPLAGKKIWSIDIASLVAGTKYRGQFEERLKNLMAELKERPDTILFIDEIHTMVGAGGSSGSLDVANMLKPALSRGEFRCIGSTTADEYSRKIEKDSALERRFQKVPVEPTGFAGTLDILLAVAPGYEKHHGVTFTEEALKSCISLSDRYIPDRSQPDKSIDLMDEAGSRARLSGTGDSGRTIKITGADIAATVSAITGVPAGSIGLSESRRLLKMADVLRREVIGQDEAVETTVRAIQRNRAGLRDPGRPIGSFLFLGPTGVGKTYLAKKISEYLFGTSDAMIRVDMSEYMEKYSVSRLIGAPPGYVGYDEGGQLTERVRRRPYSVILLDEIEKAHPDVFNILLQVMDEGHLTDSNGRSVDFRNTVLILTSNVGSRELKEFGKGIGFPTPDSDAAGRSGKRLLGKALEKTFSPEFLNRLDEQVYFRQLDRDDISRIIDMEILTLRDRLSRKGYTLHLTPSAREFISEAGYDRDYGARPLKRAVRRYVEDPVTQAVLSGHPSDRPLRIKLNREKNDTVCE